MRLHVTYGQVSISRIKSTIRDYKREYYLAMIQLIRDAAGVFVQTAVRNVHVDTGMSAASLEPFANWVDSSILHQIHPKRVRKGMTTITGKYQKQRFKSVSEGLKAGQTAFKMNFGTYNRPYMSFRYTIKVWQWLYWETNWQSLNEAVIDAEIFIENNYLKYLPRGLNKAFTFTSGVSY